MKNEPNNTPHTLDFMQLQNIAHKQSCVQSACERILCSEVSNRAKYAARLHTLPVLNSTILITPQQKIEIVWSFINQKMPRIKTTSFKNLDDNYQRSIHRSKTGGDSINWQVSFIRSECRNECKNSSSTTINPHTWRIKCSALWYLIEGGESSEQVHTYFLTWKTRLGFSSL
jgi:hypothetical protein